MALIIHDPSVNTCKLNDVKFDDPTVVYSLTIEKKQGY